MSLTIKGVTITFLTDEEALAAGWTRIDPPEVGTYGTYHWRQDDLRFPFVYTARVIWEDSHGHAS